MTTEFFECQCHSDEHTLKFSVDEEDGTIYTSTYLRNWYPWYHRLWVGVKYIFGYSKSRFGHFDCFLMKKEDQVRMLDLLKLSNEIQIKAAYKENEPPLVEEVAHHPV